MSALANADQAEASVAGKQLEWSEICGKTVPTLTIEGLAVSISGRILRTGRVRDEPYDCLHDSEKFVAMLRGKPNRPDLFTFMQPVGDQEAHHPFYHEMESLAVLRITTFKDWWKNKIRTHTRNHIRKAQKKGVDVRQVPFDDQLVRGVKAIYDESPLRQGKPFWHYHKDYETVKAGLATFLERSDFIGAFWEGELIGFIKMTSENGSAGLMHIISMIAHRDKAPTDALIMKAVELCAEKKISYLQYALWSRGGFGKFKENHSFERHDVPRYFVPLTTKGRIMLKLGLHRKLTDQLPASWRERMVALRNDWNAFRYKQRANSGTITQPGERRKVNGGAEVRVSSDREEPPK
jgi:hypothetical protein